MMRTLAANGLLMNHWGQMPARRRGRAGITNPPTEGVPVAVSEGAGQLQLSEDEKRLHELGYAQELRRRMSGFSNFAVSFTIISILSGCLDLYGYGMNTGG